MKNEGKEKKKATAVGYVAGMYVDHKGEIVDHEEQKERIKKYASENGITLQAIYEDIEQSDSVMERPGLNNLIQECVDTDIVLVDRVWSIGRTRTALKPLMKALDSKGMRLETATICFDITSQYARFWYRKPGRQTYVSTKKAIEVEKSATKAGA